MATEIGSMLSQDIITLEKGMQPAEMRLVRPSGIDAIAETIQKAEIDWAVVVDDFRQTPLFQQKKYQKDMLPGLFFERFIIKTLRDQQPAIHTYTLDPILPPHGKQQYYDTPQYHFTRDPLGGNLLVASLERPGNQIAEYDLITMHDVPTIWEIKMKSPKSTSNTTRGSLESVIRPTERDKRIKPIVEALQPVDGKCGFIAVIGEEQVKTGSWYQEELVRSGGVIIPFGMKYKEYLRQAQAAIEQYSL